MDSSTALRRAAHQAVAKARRQGRLSKPRVCSVEGCKEWFKIDAHHEDYSKPLEVVWLCRSHHALLHWERKRLSADG